MDIPYAYGVNSFVSNFPYGLPDELQNCYGKSVGETFARHAREKLTRYNFSKPQDAAIVDVLLKQCIGSQSVLYKIFIEPLKVPSQDMRKIELTYFSLSLLTYLFLNIYKNPGKEKICDDLTLAVIRKSIPSCGEEIALKQAVSEYQIRYREYTSLNQPHSSETKADPCTTLLLHCYECVLQESAAGKMLDILAATPLIVQMVSDNVEYISERVKT